MSLIYIRAARRDAGAVTEAVHQRGREVLISARYQSGGERGARDGKSEPATSSERRARFPPLTQFRVGRTKALKTFFKEKLAKPASARARFDAAAPP